MDKFKKIAAPAAAAFAILLILFLCKSSPVSKLWKGYTMLSVPAQTDKKLVNDVLSERGCGQYISLEGQSSRGFSSGYDERKALYFFDRDKSARVYYIPDAFAKEAAVAAQLLQSRFHIDAALGSKASFPFLTLLVCALAFAALFRFAENKLVFSAAALPAIFYVFCNPFYAAAAAVCLEFFALYLGQRLWRRKGALTALFSNYFVIVFSASAFLLSLVAGFVRGIFFLLNLAAAFSLLFLLFNFQTEQDKKARFLPVLIRSARTVNAMNVKTLKKAFFVSAEIFALFVLLCAGTDFLSSGSKKGLFFPAPTEYNGKYSDFPLMEDYFAEKWNSEASPYRSLNKQYPQSPKEGDKIEMTHYEKTPDGIKTRSEVLHTYNANFRKKASDELDKTDYPAIEKLWKAQGKKFSVAYLSGGSENAGFGLVAALLFAALIPLFCALAPRLKIKTERLCGLITR